MNPAARFALQAEHEVLQQQVQELETLRAENADMAALVMQLRVSAGGGQACAGRVLQPLASL